MTDKELARIFPLGADSLRQPGVPRGRVEPRHFNRSRVFPGTERDYWIYVPAQYRASRAACLLVVQDGHDHLFGKRWDMATVLDNLIHQRAMPVTIGVFVNPGKIPAARPGGAPRDNRSFEYDSMDGRYARFLLEELLPEVERDYRLRRDGNSRAIMGGSSGGFCAFNVAWERPDAFRRVVSMVGSFTPMRGGHAMPSRVRLTAPKPLRVFLEGGAQDLNLAYGDWWTANLGMLAALHFAGYEVEHAWHEQAGHNAYHPSMICPEALRWIWQGYPKRISAGSGGRLPIARVLAPQREWRDVTLPGVKVGALTVDAAGRLCLADARDGTVRRLSESGRASIVAHGAAGATELAWAADGGLMAACPDRRRALALRSTGAPKVLADGVEANGIAADGAGRLFIAEPSRGRVLTLEADGKPRIAVGGLRSPHRLALTPDGKQLLIAPRRGEHVILATIGPDGSLTNMAPYFRLEIDEGAAALKVTAMAVAKPGLVIIATRAGLQLNHTNGLVAGFMPLPGGAPIGGMALAGPKRDQLYVSRGGRLLRRRIKPLPSLWI